MFAIYTDIKIGTAAQLKAIAHAVARDAGYLNLKVGAMPTASATMMEVVLLTEEPLLAQALSDVLIVARGNIWAAPVEG